MSNIHIAVTGADAAVTASATLTGGMVGAAVAFTFADTVWETLTKIAVFQAGGVRRSVAQSDWSGGVCTIPWECLQAVGERLTVGVYGTDDTGAVVIPTVYADCGWILPGASPEGPAPADPTEPYFAALMRQTLAQAKASGAFTGPQGPAGINGKSAYAAAKDGGWIGTESAFNTALAGIVNKANKPVTRTVNLAAASWDAASLSQTVAVSGMTSSRIIIVTPTPSGWANWCKWGIRCSAQTTDRLAFKCSTVPTSGVTAQILMLT